MIAFEPSQKNVKRRKGVARLCKGTTLSGRKIPLCLNISKSPKGEKYPSIHRRKEKEHMQQDNNIVQVFTNAELGEIRTVTIEGNPWLVGKDVASCLGYKDTVNALKVHVDKADKKRWRITTPLGMQTATVINESGVYSLIFSSKLDQAKQFKRWVTTDVLPAIRKHGMYATETVIEQVLSNPDFAIKLLKQLKTEREEKARLEAQVKENEDKVLFVEAINSSKSTILIGDLAKLICQNGVNIGQIRLFEWLRDKGYLIKRDGQSYNMPTQKAMNLGLFIVKEKPFIQANGKVRLTRTTQVTTRGQQYFIDLFLKEKVKNEEKVS